MKQNRREFLIKSGCALSMTALATQMRHFGLMSAMAQEKTVETKNATVPNDYRALVCIFLVGGNDGNNTVIPLHSDANLSNFQTYYGLRNPQNLAFAQNVPLAIQVPRMSNLLYGFHPAFGVGATNNGIYQLWEQNKLAVVANVGTLVKPTVRSQIFDPLHPKPYNMFSHSDQAAQHQTGRSDRQIFNGWGGRLSDLRATVDNPGASIPMITSVAGAQFFTAGQMTVPLAIAPAPVGLDEVLNPQGYDATTDSQSQLAALNALRSQDLSTEIIAAASHITDQAITVNAPLQTYQEVTVPFPSSNIGNQLKQIARLIKKRTELNVNRQIFFCQINGFDTHNLQLPNQSILLAQMSQAMRSFYDEMVVQGLGDKVTQFTLVGFWAHDESCRIGSRSRFGSRLVKLSFRRRRRHHGKRFLRSQHLKRHAFPDARSGRTGRRGFQPRRTRTLDSDRLRRTIRRHSRPLVRSAGSQYGQRLSENRQFYKYESRIYGTGLTN